METRRHDMGVPGHETFVGLPHRLERLASEKVPFDAFLRDLLELETDYLAALYGAAWVQGQAAGEVALLSEIAEAVGPPAVQVWRVPLRNLAAKVLADGAYEVQAIGEPADRLLSGSRYVAVGIPVAGHAAPLAVLTLVVRETDALWSGRPAAGAQVIAGYGALFVANRAGGAFKTRYEDLSRAWDLAAAALAFDEPATIAQVLANKARALFNVKRVTVGLNRRGKVAVAAISEQDVFDKRSALVRSLRSAQEEALVEAQPVALVSPTDGSPPDHGFPAHLALIEKDPPGAGVFTVPLRASESVVALWTFETDPDKPLTEDQRTLIQIASGQLGPVLALANKATRNLWQRFLDASRAAVVWLLGELHPGRRAAVVLIAAAVLFLAFFRITLRVGGRCVLEPSVRRTYCAPFDSVLMETHVVPGDTVAAGDPLVDLDREEIDLALREARSELVRTEKEIDIYLTQEKRADFGVSSAKREGLLARIALLEKRLREATIRAESEGIVLSGDLRQLIGSPVKTGDALLEVAPLERMTLLVELDEGDAAFVKPDQRIAFTTKARPDLRVETTVLKLRPGSEVRQNRNVFVVEADVENGGDRWLRPGMEGVAKIDAGRGVVAWVWSRRLVNWIRMRLW
ncbi:MAG: HlyD family efflux transporter periplasmic adaptor subunit [Planctomycetota bacterium]